MPPAAQSPIPIWLTRNSSAPIHDQLVTQILLGILSKDLKPDQRLPSVRALARMLRVHPNTVSGVYQELVHRGWLESRRGSGMYVRAAPAGQRSRLEQLLGSFVDEARSEGWTNSMIRQTLECELIRGVGTYLSLFEPEPELRAVLLYEIEQATGQRPGTLPASGPHVLTVATPGRAQLLDKTLPAGAPRMLLQLASIPAALAGRQPPSPNELIGLASASREILNRAKMVLLAAGIDSGTLVECDCRESGWRHRAVACDMIISDALAAQSLAAHPRLHVLHVLSTEALESLKRHFESCGHGTT